MRISKERERKHGVCHRAACRRRHRVDFWKRAAQGKLRSREEFAQAVRHVRDRNDEVQGIPSAGRVPVVVPANTARLVNLPARRRRRFRDILTRRISQAAERVCQGRDTESPQAMAARPHARGVDSPVSGVLAHACATCRGHCCRPGYNTALLKVDTLEDYMRRNPRLRPRQVLDAYLEKLPQKAYEHSCVYHAEGGCALPRTMRSETCNTYFCDNLQVVARDDPAPAVHLIVAMVGRTPVRATEWGAS